MSTICLNCSAPVDENYCPRCGQKVEVKRLTWHNLGEEILHFFTHVEKGFLKTTGQLIVYPGRLCKNYLDGKRKIYQKPVSFFLIWIAIYLFIWYLADHFAHFENRYTSDIIFWDASTVNFIQKYRSVVDILILPATAFVNWLILARPKLNYVEVLCISFYLFSFSFIVHVVNISISLLLSVNYKNNVSQYIAVALLGSWALYAGYDLYKRYNVRFLIPRLILWIISSLFVYIYAGKIIVMLLMALGF
jgi:hypothetical protein